MYEMTTSRFSLLFSSWWKSRPFAENPFRRTHIYGAISKGEDVQSVSQASLFGSDAEPAHSKPPKRWLLKACILICTVIVLTVELMFIILMPKPTPANGPTDIHDTSAPYTFTNTSGLAGCGNTADTALALGCKFDHLTISWETPECYHPDIVDSFLSVHDWKYYNDSLGTPIPPGTSITDGHQRWNVNWDFHFTHCVYTWKMMQKAVFERRPMADNLLDLEHTRHCMEMLLEKRFPWDDMHTMIHVKWPKCASFEEWNTAKWVENLVLPS